MQKWVKGNSLKECFKKKVVGYEEKIDDNSKLVICSGLFRGYALTFRYLSGEYLRVEINYIDVQIVPGLCVKEAIGFFSKALGLKNPILPTCKFKLFYNGLKILCIEWSKNPEEFYKVRKALTKVDSLTKELKRLF